MSEREPTLEERAVIETAEKNGRRIVKEPLIYQAEGARSYFSDLAMRERGNTVAAERLAHHERQMAAIPSREVRTVPGTEFEYRVPPNVTTGTGGEFAPPLWVNELFATARRPGQIIQRLAHTFDLPGGVSSVNLPRITQGSEADSQVPGAPVPSQDIETKTVKSKAITFAGNSDWSIQALEQSPKGAYLDWVVFTDLTESLDANVEIQLVNGRGEASEELLGLANITGINAISNSEAVEVKKLFPILAQAIGGIGVNRKRPPDAWLMTSARFGWLCLMEDTNEQRPLIITDNVKGEFPVASMAGFSVYLDDAIPRTVNTNQEPIFCVRSDDFMIWLSAPRTMVMEDVLSGSLGVRFQLHRTVAALLHRYPSGISAVTGSGMKAQQGATEYLYA